MKELPINSLANMVPMASAIEQEALNNDIATNGFNKAAGLLKLWNGELIDGRCRQVALLAANLLPADYAEDVGNLTFKEAETLVLQLNTRRNLTDTQKAISAYNLSKQKGHTQLTASKQFGIGLKTVQYVAALQRTALLTNNSVLYNILCKGGSSKSGTRGGFWKLSSSSLLDELSKGSALKLPLADIASQYYTTSIKTIAKQLKLLLEEASLIVTSEEEIEWNPDSTIKTEAGKQIYYTLTSTETLSIPIKMALVEFVNLKYKLPLKEEALDTSPTNRTLAQHELLWSSYTVEEQEELTPLILELQVL